jgi:hypothetical protein
MPGACKGGLIIPSNYYLLRSGIIEYYREPCQY